MGEMARLIVSREEADLVTHELTRDVITIGSAPLNHIVIERSRGIRAARDTRESRRVLLAERFAVNKRDTGQWRFY